MDNALLCDGGGRAGDCRVRRCGGVPIICNGAAGLDDYSSARSSVARAIDTLSALMVLPTHITAPPFK